MSAAPAFAWWSFAVSLVVLLAIDLLVHRGRALDTQRAAVFWTGLWIAVGLLFNAFVWLVMGATAAEEYLAAYLMEKSLSVDNLFVFLVVFQSLGIEARHQRKVLTWGILGALVFRALFIFLGAEALERYDAVTWVFGAILLYAAVRSFRERPHEVGESALVRVLSRRLPLSREAHGGAFFVTREGRRHVTTLFVALVAVELTDVLFAVDSVPAAFSVTRDTFLVYTSNAFAILGLRSLYLVLARVLEKLRFLHYGLAAVLAFAAVKMVVDRWVHIPPLVSVALIAFFILLSAVASLAAGPRARTSPHALVDDSVTWGRP